MNNEEISNKPKEEDKTKLEEENNNEPKEEINIRQIIPIKEDKSKTKKPKIEYTPTERGDEYEIEIDPKGETKVDINGKLLGDRQYRVPTFTLIDRGEVLFMLATKVARLLNLRDSHNLFTKYPMLFKIPLTNRDKYDLIDRKILPLSYKGRSINVVTAKSIYKIFGAKMIIDGKLVVDDYYEQKAIDLGFKSGEPAYILYDPTLPIEEVNNPMINIASTINLNEKFSIKSNITKTMINEENWMLTHCLASKQFDYDSSYDRIKLWNLKFIERDSYTGIKFLPKNTQSSSKNWKILKFKNNNYIKNDSKSGKLTYKTVIECNNLIKSTGLLDVKDEIFEGVVSDEVRNAILKQKEFEKNK